MIASYLRRIGLPAPSGGSLADCRAEWGPATGVAAAERLRALAGAHWAGVPFENLGLHAGEPVSVDPDVIVPKIVQRHRGGICYELNGGLGWLLAQLGWTVAFHGGRVRTTQGNGSVGSWGAPLGHLALVVEVPGDLGPDRWLVDVGFGGELVLGPVSRTVSGLDGPEAEAVVRGSDGRPAGYLLETRSRPLTDFAAMAGWHSTSSAARFTGSLVCTLTVDGRRTTLAGRRLKITVGDRDVADRMITDPQEVLAVYRDTYGIELAVEPAPGVFGVPDQRQSVANGRPR